jgi:hypothetical protein
MITQIKTIAGVQAFAHQLVEEGLTGGFHPDDPFTDYTQADGQPLYTAEEAATREVLLEQCFEICGDDVYEVIGRITLKGTPMESMFDEDHQERYEAFMKQIELGIKEYNPSPVANTAVREVLQARYN